MKLWKLKPQIPENIADVYKDYHPLLSQLLFNRGLKKKEDIKNFLETDYEAGLHSPFLFRGMEKAVERIWQAIERKEIITIYGDYDADAITANAVLRQAFKYLGANVESYIPDRFSEGYGVNLNALSAIKDKGTKIIITVDCGTNSVDAAEWCEKNGIDFIITDHHEIIGDLPKAFALINPKNSGDLYPDREITGVGVAFKLAQALLTSEKLKMTSEKFISGYEKWLLDLVAIGTVADCHALTGENRIFVKYGLKVLSKTKWQGLRALAVASGLGEQTSFGVVFKAVPDTYALGFVIAPRLNAAGRLEHADIALKLLLEDNFLEAKKQAELLEKINQRRQDITARIMSEAREQAEKINHRKVLVMMAEGWHKGVVGLVAGKIAEEFYRPTIILEKGEIEATGSARSVGEFDIVEALKSSQGHLLRFGGHKQAAGLTLKTEKFELFYQSVLEFAEKNMEADQPPILHLDAELLPSDLQFTTYNLLTALEPFGVNNPKPKFLISNAEILSIKPVGAQGQHMQIQVKLKEKVLSCIGFNFSGKILGVKIGDNIDIACELIADFWNGQQKLKLRLIDIKKNG